MTDTSGPTFYAPLGKWDHDSRSWKTSEATSLWALTLSSLTLPAWGGLHDGELCEHPTPVRLTNALDYSSLPTPSANDTTGAEDQAQRKIRGAGGPMLRDLPTLLPTPAVNDMGEGKTLEWWDKWAPRQKAADGRPAPHGRSLAIEAQRLLPTPQAAEARARFNTGGNPMLNEVVTNLLPTPKATNNENTQSLDRYGMNWGMALQSFGEITAPPSPDGSASSDDQPQHQLSLDVQGIPA